MKERDTILIAGVIICLMVLLFITIMVCGYYSSKEYYAQENRVITAEDTLCETNDMNYLESSPEVCVQFGCVCDGFGCDIPLKCRIERDNNNQLSIGDCYCGVIKISR